MKRINKFNLLIGLITLCSFTYRSFAQIPVTDAAANAQQMQTNNLISMGNNYAKMTQQIAKDDLQEAKKTGETINKQYEKLTEQTQTIKEVYQGGQMIIQQVQKVRDFFNEQQKVLQRIQKVSSLLSENDVRLAGQGNITKAREFLQAAANLITKSSSYSTGAFSNNKMTLNERLKFIDDGYDVLKQAGTQISSAQTILKSAQQKSDKYKNQKKLIKAIF